MRRCGSPDGHSIPKPAGASSTARFIVTELITNLPSRRDLPAALTSPLTLRGSTDSGSFFGGNCTHLIGSRVEKSPSEIGVVDCSREDHRTDHRRENRHCPVAELVALGVANPTAEYLELFFDPGFEWRL